MLSVRGIVILYAALATLVHGHGALVGIQGANGVNGAGLGIIASTPRDGSTRNPFEQDTSIIRDREIAQGKADACGRTLAGGNNDIATGVEAASDAGLPSIAADGTVSMTLHQVNQDGAGPYTCEISTDATGSSFTPMTVTTNVPGKNSLSRAKATDFPLVAQAPAGTNCTGGPAGDACIVRCRNSAIAGPFGGCAVVTNAGSDNSTSTSNSTTTDTSTSTDTAVATNSTSTDSAAATDTAVVTDTATATATDASNSTVTDTAVANATSTVDTAAAAATETAAVASGKKHKGHKQKNLLARFFDYFDKRDDSRKRIVRSRIVEEQKRSVWI